MTKWLLCTCPSCLPFDDRQFHVPDLDANKKEVDLPYDHILEVVPDNEIIIVELHRYGEMCAV